MAGSNLAGWLFGGGTKGRELRETRAQWDRAQQLWRASPFGSGAFTGPLGVVLDDIYDRCPRLPSQAVRTAIAEFVWDCLWEEPVRDLSPRWDAIESDASVAIEFREINALRIRWFSDYPQMFGTFKQVIAETVAAFVDRLPEACFEECATEQPDLFEVPLLDLMDDPQTVVQVLFAMPYADAAVMRLDLFKRLRAQSGVNIIMASGFRADADHQLVKNRLKYPADLDGRTGAELAELYLRHTPARELVDLPVPFNIPDSARFEHCHVVGGTGHGKTQLLQKMIHSDLMKAREDGRSVIVIDSQGDLINKLVRLDLFSPDAPNSLADRLVLIDPSDVEFPAALNLFDAHLDRVRDYSAADRERVLNGVVELYELFFGAFLGAELTQKQGVIFRYLARLMLAIPDATIHTLIAIMEDGKHYKPYMDKLDGSAKHFFETEFFHPSFTATKKQVIRRLWGVLSTPAFERMFTQPKNKLDLFDAMNAGKIILVSTAKDLLKRDGSQLLGRFFIAMIMQAALERSTVKDYLRTPCFVHVDEAQEYFDDSVETILNQARKYRVGLTLAHQTLDQLSPGLRSAVLSNTSIKCAGGVSNKDARTLAPELHTTPEFIESMKRRKDRSEFALYVKQQTSQAIRLTVPLGFLERQSTLDLDDYDRLLDYNHASYCGTLADIQRPLALPAPELSAVPAPSPPLAQEAHEARSAPVSVPEPKQPEPIPARSVASSPQAKERAMRPAREEDLSAAEPGKGGRQHKYLQSLAKELAEQNGLKATIEAALPQGGGQVDVLIERDGPLAAIEISVSTPVEWEKANVAKCLAAGYPRVGLILAKSKRVQASYRTALMAALNEQERERVSFLTPEELPDFIASLAPPPEPTERIVKGYKVKGAVRATTPEEAKARRDAIAKLVMRSFDEG